MQLNIFPRMFSSRVPAAAINHFISANILFPNYARTECIQRRILCNGFSNTTTEHRTNKQEVWSSFTTNAFKHCTPVIHLCLSSIMAGHAFLSTLLLLPVLSYCAFRMLLKYLDYRVRHA